MSLQNLWSKVHKKISLIRESVDFNSVKRALLQRVPLERMFKPSSTSGIRKLQFFWAGVIVLAFLGAFYSALIFFFHKKPVSKLEEEKKATPTLIETLPRKQYDPGQ